MAADYLKLSDDPPYSQLGVRVICACEYSAMVKEALLRFKFHQKAAYYRSFAVLLSKKIKKMTNFRNFDIIIGVPLHASRERERGYNQSSLIAKALSRELQVPASNTVLSRVKITNSQSLLNRNARLSNVRDAFQVNRPEKIRGRSILLVDDIITTGATLGECCKVLLEAGAGEVTCAVVASGRK